MCVTASLKQTPYVALGQPSKRLPKAIKQSEAKLSSLGQSHQPTVIGLEKSEPFYMEPHSFASIVPTMFHRFASLICLKKR